MSSPLTHKQLLERILRAVDESQWQAIILDHEKPFRIRLFREREEGFNVRIYIWNCTHAAALQKVLADFKALGYEVSYELYHAADYGVPQTRERVIIVGTLPEIKPFKPPTQTHDAQTYITAREALHDLVSMVEAESINHIWSRASRSPEQGDRRLLADRPGYTIRAECHGNIQWHYNLPRRISMREAARIQSFPDNFIFDAKLRETERQIGNAVPPVLAWHIAKSVAKVLKSPVEWG